MGPTPALECIWWSSIGEGLLPTGVLIQKILLLPRLIGGLWGRGGGVQTNKKIQKIIKCYIYPPTHASS